MYIEAINLTKKYGNFFALKELNVKFEGAKCIGYLGPNGAGKTTTLKLFTNLLNPTSGKAIINGYCVKDESTKALSNVGTLIETPGLYPYLTPSELLQMLCELRMASNCDIKSALEEVGMYEWRNKKTGKFSKGMKQRVALAAALITNPEILILDEPTSGMDPRGMAEIREVIKSLKKEKRMILMSSHLLPEVTDVCEEVAMINHGKLLLYESIDNLNNKFRENSVMVTALNDIDEERVRAIDMVKSVEKLSPKKIKIEFEGDDNTRYLLLSKLLSSGVKVVDYRLSGMPLEKAYLEMIGGEINE